MIKDISVAFTSTENTENDATVNIYIYIYMDCYWPINVKRCV